MPINVKISLCKITAASKLFQRNYYLPLLKPLSPKDALRRKIITGQNVLGNRTEHYIPVLKKEEEKSTDRKRRGKGVPVIKKRCKRKENERYVEPFFDENMENHNLLQVLLRRKPKGKNKYIYEVPDKKCTLVISAQMEKALKDRDIVDIIIAQRSEKIVVKLQNGTRVTLPLASYQDYDTLYRGSGWTKEFAEQEHHHGKETMSIAKLFEAKESGVEEWELEMMRMANKRKKKHKGEDNKDWKNMLSGCVENMDWDKFEEDTKQIVDEQEEIVTEEDIPMAVDDMEKTTNVAEKLKQGGSAVLDQLPVMKEIPEVIKILETGDMCEISNVSGVKVNMSSGKVCFVTGQLVKSDESEVFVPGQTVIIEDGSKEYTPGITILDNGEPTLIPGLVMGEEQTNAMFLPGDSKITDGGQLKFEATDGDRGRRAPSPSPPPPPKPKKEEEIVIKRRVIAEPEEEPVRKERVRKREPIVMSRPLTPPREVYKPARTPLDDQIDAMEEERKRREAEERKRQKDRMEEKILKEESKVDTLRLGIRKKLKDFKIEKPKEYVPVDPVKKTQKLEEMEQKIRKGTFFEDDKTKEILERARMSMRQSAMSSFGGDFGRGRF
ncbi:unnamed protein product [Brassicogethes aeneus]|uniref:Uncharacterized protein n=1 Tax=Brassicogethes aeneus TaxID=1431903 RepID=A0A9P0AW53_BRAAE|nr:unnamed protein product [Brassicogethes aeneus]